MARRPDPSRSSNTVMFWPGLKKTPMSPDAMTLSESLPPGIGGRLKQPSSTLSGQPADHFHCHVS